jgi:1A family penicillin-binding protein
VLARVFSGLPSLEALDDPPTLPSVRIEDRHGRLLYELIAETGGRHRTVPLEQIPAVLQQATIATEDSTFYTNPGFDLRGVLRALWINLRGGETLAGGSTITQQVARNLLLEAGERGERTLLRKLRESVLAWRLTRSLSKDDILELYLNHMNYGGMAYGVEAAARTYFDSPVVELDLAESSLIAGLPQAPALYNPLTDPEAAKARQAVVLDLMLKQGMITPEMRELAVTEPLNFAASPYPVEAPHFVFMVQAEIQRTLPQEQLFGGGGLTVRTTLDLDWQHQAERVIRDQLASLNLPDQGSPGHQVRNAALVAIDPHTGEVRALVGSPDYFEPSIAGAINMAVAPRQPGSAFKPLVYAAALDPSRPDPMTAGTLILDVHSAFVTHEGLSYAPVNFDRVEHGPVLLREALGSSLNIPAVRTIDHVGVASVIQLARELGLTTLGDPDEYDLSLALGSAEVRLIELTAAYAAFANGGYRITPSAILEIRDAEGNALYTPARPQAIPALDARVAWLISDILSDNEARTLGFGENSTLRIDRPAAVKTGTTTNFRDNWTIGYTPSVVVGVWVGNADSRPMLNVTGVSGAGPIWHQFMRRVSVGDPPQDFERPDGLVQVEICALSGALPTSACPYRRQEWYLPGSQPTQFDTFYRAVNVDVATGCLVEQVEASAGTVERLALDLPPEAHAWARSENLLLLADLDCALELAATRGDDERLQVLSPDPNSLFLIAPTIPLEAQGMRVAAAATEPLTVVELWLDGEILAEFIAPPYEIWWTPSVGVHQIWAEGVTPAGKRVSSPSVNFEVRPQTP